MMQKKLLCLCAAVLFAFAAMSVVNAETTDAGCPCAAKVACQCCAKLCVPGYGAPYPYPCAYPYYAPVVYRAPLLCGIFRPAVAYPYPCYGYPYGYYRPYGCCW